MVYGIFFFSSRRRHTRCALVTGVQTCALPIWLSANPARSVEPQVTTPIRILAGRAGGLRRLFLLPQLGLRHIVVVFVRRGWTRAEHRRLELGDQPANFLHGGHVARLGLLPKHLHVRGLHPVERFLPNRSEEHTSELQSLMRIS